MKRHIAVLQPEVPHYRDEFFAELKRRAGADLYIYNSVKQAQEAGFKTSTLEMNHIPNVQPKGILIYNPFKLLGKRYDTLVLMLHFAHLTTWLLLITRWLHRKKIVLYGQGISVKRYLKEERKPDWKLRLMISMADAVWLYMSKEEEQWQKVFPRKPIVALRNSLSGMSEIAAYSPATDIDRLKAKYNITQERVLLFCARFTSPYRRVDLLMETIKRLSPERFGFIVIGDGANKPDFSAFPNVHDFGSVYDTGLKRDLFSIADIYYQPGWVGLSIVEAMGYGLPVFTFRRSPETLQCVEYSYIEDGVNGCTFTDIDSCVATINDISDNQLKTMGRNARCLATTLTPQGMVERGMSVL